MGHLSQCQKMGKMSHNFSVWNMGHWDICPIKIIWKKNLGCPRGVLSFCDLCNNGTSVTVPKKMGKMSHNFSVRNMGHWDSCPIKIIWKKNWDVQEVFYHFVTSVTMGRLSQCQKMGKLSHNFSVSNMGHLDSCPNKIIWKKIWDVQEVFYHFVTSG